MKLWAGRFNSDTDELVDIFNASIFFDQRLYYYDIKGSKAHASMLGKTEIISEGEAEKIISGLEKVEADIKQGNVDFKAAYEDIHMMVESLLIEKIGDAGKKLHTARSRNDQVALDIRLYLREEAVEIQKLLKSFLKILLNIAEKNISTIMPGYTHMQKAQPVTFAHHLLAYYYKFKRDYEKLTINYKHINIMPLGSGALAGTTFPIDREYVAKKLNFDSVSKNSIDGVSDRDFIIEFLSIASTLMMHFSRFSEEIILWASNEFNFIELDDAYSTGSSIMPQKKNPDIAELVRGKTGRVYGHLVQLLTVLKGLPLSYNKDMQEDKEGLFDTIDTVKIILRLFPKMLETMTVKNEVMKEAINSGFLDATDLADYLTKKGMPFRKAHKVVGEAVLYASKNKLKLNEISLKDWSKLFPEEKDYFKSDLKIALDPENSLNNRNLIGGPAPDNNKIIINEENEWLDGLNK